MKLIAIALLMSCLTGCAEPKPFNAMTADELESYLAERREWAEVDLKNSGQDAYTGMAKTSDGQTFKLSVTCTESSMRAVWENADRSATGEYTSQLPREVTGWK